VVRQQHPDVQSFLSLADVCQLEGKSLSTLKRELARGEGPTVTQLSLRRIAIRSDHYKLWCERRVRGAVA
jgi:hypothetical protein